jgi:hypothetical protein
MTTTAPGVGSNKFVSIFLRNWKISTKKKKNYKNKNKNNIQLNFSHIGMHG